MADRPKVSIVIPVYGVKKYIAKCIESLQRQTLKELEMIFVDDCGGDGSIEIAQEYAKEDSRIKILLNEHNMGAGPSRNRGIDAATGEFIAFVDPDDWVDDNFYEVLYERAKSGNYDIVKGSRIQVEYRENGEIRYKNSAVNDRIKAGMTQNQPLYVFFTSEHQTAIFNGDMVHEHKIYNGSASHSENSVFLLKAAFYAKRFCIESKVAYYYFQREDSSVHVFDYKKFSGELCSFKEQMEIAKTTISSTTTYLDFIGKKILFLMRRYDELQDIKELKSFRKEYLTTLADELDQVKDKNKLRKYGRRVGLLLDHKVGSYIFLNRFKNVAALGQKCKKAVVSKMKNMFYSVEENTATHKKYRLFGIPFTKKYPSPYKFDKKELVYLQSYRGCIIFCKKFLELDPEFAAAYINGFTKNNSEYNCDLPIDSELYKEHIERLKNGELCWRYTKRFGHISKTTIYQNEQQKICMRGEILGSNDIITTEHFKIHPQLEREIIDGVVLKDYITAKRGMKEVVGELRQYTDFIFEMFATENPEMIQGMAYDAFPYNCILTEGHVYELFDLEFEYKEALDRGYMLYKIVRVLGKKRRKNAYFELCEHYGIVPKWQEWDDFNFRIWLDTISEPDDTPSNEENQKLFQKYFISKC